MFIKRILLNAADLSPGNGAPVAPAIVVDPAEPAAPTPAATPTVDAKAIAAEVRDSLFAELRRAGILEKSKVPAAPKSPDSAGVAADPLKLRALDRALTRTGLADKLSDTQYRRAERDFVAEDPSDADTWAKDYFHGFSGSPATVQPAVSASQPAIAPPAQTPSGPPQSNRGAPPAAKVSLDETPFHKWPQSDRDAYLKEKGSVAYRTKLNESLKGMPINFRS